MPGSLPFINRRAVEFGIMTALAIGCGINEHNRFARKHYYYPDMPKNYQISQYEEPLAEHGRLVVDAGAGPREIGIQRVHLEEDVGKLIHEGALETAQSSSVDYNRAGVPLMEIVSKPDLRSPDEAAAYLGPCAPSCVYLGVCDGNMEEGSLRCDANISLRPRGQTEYGTKVEIKNMNSFRNVRDALEHEIKRQTRALETGERIVQETRLWDPDRMVTVSMRSKEFAHDYRYFPEPDLPPLDVQPAWVEAVRARLPELPEARRARFQSRLRPLGLRGRSPDPGARPGRLLRGGDARGRQAQERGQLGAQRAAPRAAGRRRPRDRGLPDPARATWPGCSP